MDKFITFLVASIQFITITVAKHNCGIVSMQEWSGELNRINETLNTPVGMVVIQHTASPPCQSDSHCEAAVREIRDFLIQAGHDDVGMSFLVGGTGKIYEGSGWNRVGAHTIGYNDKSIAISFIGDFKSLLPSPEALHAAKLLLECGKKNQFLNEDYSLVGQRQLIPTISPGDRLQNEIKTWPHWTDTMKKV